MKSLARLWRDNYFNILTSIMSFSVKLQKRCIFLLFKWETGWYNMYIIWFNKTVKTLKWTIWCITLYVQWFKPMLKSSEHEKL